LQIADALLSSLNKAGVVFLNAELLLIMGVAYMKQNLYPEADNKFREALQVAIRLGSRKALWQINYHLGKCARELGNHSEAEKYFRQSKDHMRYILKHIQDDDVRNAFLSRKEVKFLIELEDYFEKQRGV
jgi:tetratricopeptide (TPR) repeat protein